MVHCPPPRPHEARPDPKPSSCFSRIPCAGDSDQEVGGSGRAQAAEKNESRDQAIFRLKIGGDSEARPEPPSKVHADHRRRGEIGDPPPAAPGRRERAATARPSPRPNSSSASRGIPVQLTDLPVLRQLSHRFARKVEVLKNVKEQRAKEAELERQEKETEQETRRKSRVSEAQEEVAKGALDIKKEITRRSSEQFSPPPTDQVGTDENGESPVREHTPETKTWSPKIEKTHTIFRPRLPLRTPEGFQEAEGGQCVRPRAQARLAHRGQSARGSVQGAKGRARRGSHHLQERQGGEAEGRPRDSLPGRYDRHRRHLSSPPPSPPFLARFPDKFLSLSHFSLSSDGDEITLNSLDGAIKIKAKTSVGGPLGERKASENGGSDGQTPDWQKDSWNSDRKLTGKHGFLLKKGGSKRNENGRSVKLFTRHNWNTRFFMVRPPPPPPFGERTNAQLARSTPGVSSLTETHAPRSHPTLPPPY